MRRGWCPTVHEPMASGDGLLARVKPSAGRIGAEDALALAAAAARFGNGTVELTSRANLQFRGFSAEGARAFAEIVVSRGLALPDAGAERRRNVICGPMASPDAVRLARALEAMLADDALAGLPAKFGLAVDCADAPGDIHVRVADGLAHVSMGGEHGWSCATDDAAGAVGSSLASHCLDPRVNGAAPERIASCVIRLRSDQPALILHLPFGQLPLRALAEIARDRGDGTIRLTPWRAVLLPGVPATVAPPRGCVTDPDDPALRITACVGRPGCASARADTRADAASLIHAGIVGRVHLSGCAKGCGRPPGVRMLVGEDGRYGPP